MGASNKKIFLIRIKQDQYRQTGEKYTKNTWPNLFLRGFQKFFSKQLFPLLIISILHHRQGRAGRGGGAGNHATPPPLPDSQGAVPPLAVWQNMYVFF